MVLFYQANMKTEKRIVKIQARNVNISAGNVYIPEANVIILRMYTRMIRLHKPEFIGVSDGFILGLSPGLL